MRHDMDATTMAKRAHEQGAVLQSYDPNRLVGQVQELLWAHGLDPDLPPGTGRAGMATGAAGALLRAFGILPASDVTSVDRPTTADPDNR